MRPIYRLRDSVEGMNDVGQLVTVPAGSLVQATACGLVHDDDPESYRLTIVELDEGGWLTEVSYDGAWPDLLQPPAPFDLRLKVPLADPPPGRTVAEAPCVFCGKRIKHIDDCREAGDNAVGCVAAGLVLGERQYYLYCNDPCCQERVFQSLVGRGVWMCEETGESFDVVGRRCPYCLRLKREHRNRDEASPARTANRKGSMANTLAAAPGTSLQQLVGKTVQRIVRDAADEDSFLGLQFTDGTVAWIQSDGEGNSSGYLNIEPVPLATGAR